ncbi:MAG: pitrilysin family protein [Candidatus Competibacteraceae bacterium]|jgi:zinc protease|nr:pitrilysin family protein [Candidatus Competibacteraceae bacterium]
MYKLTLFNAALFVLALLPSLASAVPTIQHWQTANGAKVYFVAAPELPMVDVQVVFDAGSARDESKPGIAKFVNALLHSGTEKLSADVVAERLDALGAQLGGGAERDMAWMSLRSLSEAQYLDTAVNTVASLLQEPAFASTSMERERNRLIAGVRAGNQSPGTIAARAFYQTLYAEHPYASPPEGTEVSLQTITQGDLKAFHSRYYVAANAVVAIVGNLDRERAEAVAMVLVGSLPVGEAAPDLPPVQPLTQAQVVRIEHPSSQAHVLIGQLGMKRHDPDYFSLFLGNHVLGGSGLISRLAEEVREKRGLSYSTYSYFAPMRQAGPFVMGLQTLNEQAEEAIDVTEATLKEFVTQGPTPNLLEAARQNITGGFPLRIDSNGKIVRYLAAIGFYELPLDYLDVFTAKINAISQQQVNDALKRRLNPDQLLTVVVGG